MNAKSNPARVFPLIRGTIGPIRLNYRDSTVLKYLAYDYSVLLYDDSAKFGAYLYDDSDNLEHTCTMIVLNLEHTCTMIVQNLEHTCTMIVLNLEHTCTMIVLNLEHTCTMIVLNLEHTCITWTLRKVDQKYLGSFKIWCWRWMQIIIWTDRVRNEQVLHIPERK